MSRATQKVNVSGRQNGTFCHSDELPVPRPTILGKKNSFELGDVKNALRSGFAKLGSSNQFIVVWSPAGCTLGGPFVFLEIPACSSS